MNNIEYHTNYESGILAVNSFILIIQQHIKTSLSWAGPRSALIEVSSCTELKKMMFELSWFFENTNYTYTSFTFE